LLIEMSPIGPFIDAYCHDIAVAQFAVDGEIEYREIAGALLEPQLRSDRPGVSCAPISLPRFQG
jgi:hypothetical protein